MPSETPYEDESVADPYPSVHVDCDCGRPITLYFNGGELDRETCPCGRLVELVATGYAVRRHRLGGDRG